MGIKTVPQPPYSRDLALCNFWLFPKFTESRYETIEKMKEAVMKVNDTLTQENFHGVFQKLLERSNKCIAAGWDYFEGDKSFIGVLSIKVPIRKKSGNLFNDPRILDKFRTFRWIMKRTDTLLYCFKWMSWVWQQILSDDQAFVITISSVFPSTFVSMQQFNTEKIRNLN